MKKKRQGNCCVSGEAILRDCWWVRWPAQGHYFSVDRSVYSSFVDRVPDGRRRWILGSKVASYLGLNYEMMVRPSVRDSGGGAQ